MCPMMFHDIAAVMDGNHWTLQQDGAKSHTTNNSVQWLTSNTPDFISPAQWPAKCPDLNVLDFSLWGILLAGVAARRENIDNVEQLKTTLIDCWNEIPLETIQAACASWLLRLRRCVEMRGGQFEHLL